MIKIGVIGVGDYGRLHMDALTQREKEIWDIRLVAFAEINEGRRKDIKNLYVR